MVSNYTFGKWRTAITERTFELAEAMAGESESLMDPVSDHQRGWPT